MATRTTPETRSPIPSSLQLWPDSEKFSQEFELANNLLAEAKAALTRRDLPNLVEAISPVRNDSEGNWRVELVSPLPVEVDNEVRDSRDPNVALAAALKYGRAGEWYIKDITELAAGRGIVISTAMHMFGYKPHRGQALKWVRVPSTKPTQNPVDVRFLHETAEVEKGLKDFDTTEDFVWLNQDKSDKTEGVYYRATRRGLLGLSFASGVTDAAPVLLSPIQRGGKRAFSMKAANLIDRDRAGVLVTIERPGDRFERRRSPLRIVLPRTTSMDRLSLVIDQFLGRVQAGLK